MNGLIHADGWFLLRTQDDYPYYSVDPIAAFAREGDGDEEWLVPYVVDWADVCLRRYEGTPFAITRRDDPEWDKHMEELRAADPTREKVEESDV